MVHALFYLGTLTERILAVQLNPLLLHFVIGSSPMSRQPYPPDQLHLA